MKYYKYEFIIITRSDKRIPCTGNTIADNIEDALLNVSYNASVACGIDDEYVVTSVKYDCEVEEDV